MRLFLGFKEVRIVATVAPCHRATMYCMYISSVATILILSS